MFPIHDENKSATRPYVNYGIIIINVALFFYFFIQGFAQFRQSIQNYGAIPIMIINGSRLWSLFTSMFLHANIIHLFGNMLYLWVFGDNIEDALGHGKYLAFYFIGGLIASFTHIASLYATLPTLGDANFEVPAIGASGAISAVLGAYLLLYPRARIRTLIFYIFISIVSVPAFYYLGFWFLYQLFMGVVSLTGVSTGVAFWAHIGGFAAGAFVAKIFGAQLKVSQLVKGKGKEKTAIRPFFPISSVRKPLVDLVTEKDKIRILTELPGVEEKNISIKVKKREVTISCEQEDIRYRTCIPLPVQVIPKVHEFTLKNGVLSFSLHRQE